MWYKIVKDGYITVIGKGSGGTQIAEAEYNDIMTVMKTVPTAQNGYAYRLKENLTWELYEVEITDDPDIISDTPEQSETEDMAAALTLLGVTPEEG